MAYCSCPATTLYPSASLDFLKSSTPQLFKKSHFAAKLLTKSNNSKRISTIGRLHRNPIFLQCTKISTPIFVSETESEYESEDDYNSTEEYSEGEEGPVSVVKNGQMRPPLLRRRRRRRYRRQYPGEEKGIAEEMRFVAMKLRNCKKILSTNISADSSESDEENKENESEKEDSCEEKNDDGNGGTWQPSMEGFLKYLVDSELVFRTVERVVDESSDVSYVYFRKTGLERSDCISKDLECLREQGNVIPAPSNPGVTYAQYLEELAEKSLPLFLCHFYNIYFSHIAGGQAIAKQVSETLLEGRELEFYKWEGDAEELLRGVREKLNALAEGREKQMLKRINKSIPFSGGDSAVDHFAVKECQFNPDLHPSRCRQCLDLVCTIHLAFPRPTAMLLIDT